MSKLILEDDNGQQTEIQIGVIRETSLTRGDVLVASYDFDASTQPSEMNKILSSLKEMFQSIVPKGVEVVTCASVDGQRKISLEVLKQES